MGFKMLVHFHGILMGKVHGIVMEFDVIFNQNSDTNQSWHFIMRDAIIMAGSFARLKFDCFLRFFGFSCYIGGL